MLGHATQSAIFKLLSPTQAGGLVATLSSAIDAALRVQRDEVLREFSRDRPDSALSRLVCDIATANGKLRGELAVDIGAVATALSLDNEQGPLSRFVGRVEKSQASLSARASAKEKPPTKKEIAKVNSTFPRSIVEALLATTPDLQREGWSMPPGTRWLSYWRAHGALEARPTAASPSARRRGRTDTALFALSSDTVRADVLPAMRDALYRMEALHQALVLKSAHKRPDGPSPCFTGSVKGDRIPGHRHATLMPLTLGKRAGRIDHVLVHAPMGFDSNPSDGALRALGAVRKIWTKDLPDVFVVLAGTGVLSDFEKAVPVVRRSRVFCSWTPFVPPRHPKEKGKDTLLGQVQAELATRGLPAASRVELQVGRRQWAALDELPPTARPWPQFRGYARRRSTRPPPCDIGLSVRLVFDREIDGPITLGYGSHFGLGAFEPCD